MLRYSWTSAFTMGWYKIGRNLHKQWNKNEVSFKKITKSYIKQKEWMMRSKTRQHRFSYENEVEKLKNDGKTMGRKTWLVLTRQGLDKNGKPLLIGTCE